ncbi:MAG: hypothetical protein ACLQVA_00295 [Candidatus Brocadiia bacterium]
MTISWNQVRITLAILGAMVLAMLLNRYLVTDKKRVERTVQDMAEAARKGDVDLLFSHVSADYDSQDMSRAQIRALAEKYLESYGAANTKIQWMTVNVSGVFARAQVSISASTRRDFPAWSGTTEWAVEFRKESDGAWRVTSIMPGRIFGREVTGWRDLMRRLE